MSLRWRITGALVLLVAAAVAAGTASHLSEVSRQLEASLEQQGARVVASIRTELEVDLAGRYHGSDAFADSWFGIVDLDYRGRGIGDEIDKALIHAQRAGPALGQVVGTD